VDASDKIANMLVTPVRAGTQSSFLRNPKFLQNKIHEENFCLKFLFNICHCNSDLTFKCQNYYIASQHCMYSGDLNTGQVWYSNG
jgi:hypothetical protein